MSDETTPTNADELRQVRAANIRRRLRNILSGAAIGTAIGAPIAPGLLALMGETRLKKYLLAALESGLLGGILGGYYGYRGYGTPLSLSAARRARAALKEPLPVHYRAFYSTSGPEARYAFLLRQGLSPLEIRTAVSRLPRETKLKAFYGERALEKSPEKQKQLLQRLDELLSREIKNPMDLTLFARIPPIIM